MLDRPAARCLQQSGRASGGVPHLSRAKQCVHSRRLLHSSFWHHAAGDLDLPAWCFTSMQALFEPTGGAAAEHSRQADTPSATGFSGGFLDFLYPARTRTMMRKLSVVGMRRWRRQFQQKHRDVIVRPVATAAVAKTEASNFGYQDSDNIDTSEAISPTVKLLPAEDETAKSLQRIEAIRSLSSESFVKRAQERAIDQMWTMFKSLDTVALSPADLNKLVHFFDLPSDVHSTRSRQIRIMEVCRRLRPGDYDRDTYYACMRAMVNLGEDDDIIETHGKAVANRSNRDAVKMTGALLIMCMRRHNWELLFDVLEANLESVSESLHEEKYKEELLMQLGSEEKMVRYLVQFSAFALKHPTIISEQQHRLDFINGIVHWILDNKLQLKHHLQIDFLDLLDHHSPNMNNIFRHACLTAIERSDTDAERNLSDAMQIFGLLKQSMRYKPDMVLLSKLIWCAGQTCNPKVLWEMYEDWQKNYSRMSEGIVLTTIEAFLTTGDEKAAERILHGYLACDKPPSLKLLHPFLHFQATQGYPDKVKAWMERLKNEYQLRPNVVCWNSLVLAHCKNEDLQEAFHTFSEMLQHEFQPDEFTIGALMSVSARRGDIGLVQALALKVAPSYGIDQLPTRHQSLITAYLAHDDITNALMVARKAAAEQLKADTTRLYNQILNHEALKRQPKSLARTHMIAQEMDTRSIPRDAQSFSALMKAYTVHGLPSLAYRVLDIQMPEADIRPTALHYAILVEGYAQSGQNYESGFKVHNRMLQDGIRPTMNNHIALMKLQVSRLTKLAAMHRRPRQFEMAEEELAKILQRTTVSHHSKHDIILDGSQIHVSRKQLGLLFEPLITAYGHAGATPALKDLLDVYAEEVAKEGLKTERPQLPLHIMATVMRKADRSRDVDRVRHYWNMSKALALKMYQISKPSASTLDARIRGDFHPPSQFIAPSFSHVLQEHLRIYLASLNGQGHFDKMVKTMQEVSQEGFEVGTENWNFLVSALIRTGRVLEAFRVCEDHLMPDWPGWDPDEDGLKEIRGRKPKGLDFIGPEASQLFQRSQTLPTYKTMIRLNLVLRRLKNAATRNQDKAKSTLEDIAQQAPLTMEALSTTPIFGHHRDIRHLTGKDDPLRRGKPIL